MTPEEKLKEIEACTGPCGKACVSCIEMYCLKEIRDAMAELIRQRDMYKAMCEEKKTESI